MNYAFNLEFEELDEDLKERKIKEVLDYWYEQGDRDPGMSDEDYKKEAEDYIRAHFPVYF